MVKVTLEDLKSEIHKESTGDHAFIAVLKNTHEGNTEADIHILSGGPVAPIYIRHIGCAVCKFAAEISRAKGAPEFIDLYQLMIDGICETACNEIYKEKKDKKKLLRYRMTKNLILKLIKKYIKS